MPAFKDCNGREWIIKLDAPKIRAVRQELNVDLAAVDGSAFERLHDDEVLLVDALWILCRDQAKDATPQQFGEALVGDAIEKATEALLAAIVDFFPSRKRTLLQTLANKNKTIREAGMARAMERLNDPDLERKLLEAQDAEIEAQIQKVLTRLNSVTSGPESSESVPAA